MNKRIQELAKHAKLRAPILLQYWGMIDALTDSEQEELQNIEKFAELIVQECIQTIENRAPGQMDKEGEGWTNGYDDGLKTSAWLIRQHFGVEQ